MPLHDFVCPRHGRFEQFVANPVPKKVGCPQCGYASELRIFFAPFTRGDIQEYASPVDGRPISGRRARNEDLRRNNCVEYDPEMKKDVSRRRQEDDKKLDKAIDDALRVEVNRRV